MKDSIVKEIRQIREAHARQFNFDLHAIAEDLRRKEQACGRRLVSLPPRPVLKRLGSER